MSQPLRAVLVGCGSISRAWTNAAAQIENLELAGFVDLNETAARARAGECGRADALISTDLDAALEQLQPDIVFDCTVPQAHVNVVLTAFQHGAHVLGEKPLADSLENAHRMIEASQKAGRFYAIMQQRRFDPNIRRLRSLVESGALGPLTMVNSDFFVGAHFGDFRDSMPHILLLDMAIHTFDAARFITGADAVSVYCKEWNPAGSWYAQDAAAIAIFEMSNGIVYNYRGNWAAEGLRTSWESEWRVVGQQGSAHWYGDERLQAQRVVDGPREGLFLPLREVEIPADAPPGKTGGHTGMIRHFVESVRTGTTPENLATDNIKSLAMCFAAIESARLGRPVDVRW